LITRRDFLKSATLSVFSLSALSLLPSGCADYPEPPQPLQVLSPKEHAVLHALAQRILPLEKEDPIDVASSIDQYLATLPPIYQSQFKGLLLLFEYSPFLLGFYGARFSHLNSQQQDESLEAWARSRFGWRRMGFQAVKSLCMQRYYMDERTWGRIGYDGPWVKKSLPLK
jgi:hypothetical protein